MRQLLITAIISSSCLMVMLGYQNCTKNQNVTVKANPVSVVNNK